MLEALAHFIVFLLETIVLVAAILIIVAGLISIISKSKDKLRGQIQVKNLNDHYEEMNETLSDAILSKAERKAIAKTKKQDKKAAKKADKKKIEPSKKCLFVVDFKGDMKASSVYNLREEVSAILTTARANDEVLIRLESPGGIVFSYGLAASQLQRLRDANIRFTVAVDKMAASGGYMMACVADNIIAAPFAIIGSIGVVAQIPNFHRLLKKKEIDFEQITAGEYKRTMTVFGENTDSDRAKVQDEVNETHELFKDFIREHRPALDLEKVATGEHWFAKKALTLGLVDELCTSDDYLLKAAKDTQLLKVTFPTPKKFGQRAAETVQLCLEKSFSLFQRKPEY